MKIVAIGESSGIRPSKVNIALGKAGFAYIMLDLASFCPEQLLEHKEERWQEYLVHKEALGNAWISEKSIFLSEEPQRMAEAVENHLKNIKICNMENVIGRAPTLPADTKRGDLDGLLYELTTESIHISKEAGCEYIIIEPLVKNVCNCEDMDRNTEFYMAFARKAKELEMKILIRNRYRILNGRFFRGVWSDTYRFGEYIDKLNERAGADIYGICLDTGVCSLLGQNMQELIQDWGERIWAVLVRENDGITDSSMLPFGCVYQNQSKTDWLGFIRGMRKINFDGLLLCDFTSQRLAVSHLLCQDITLYAKKVMDFLYWQINMENVIRGYEKRVLFGAGNMCRNYMKCYGEKYPPLFTCDNNPRLWGSTFEGLEIKNPEELKKLSPECAVFICNVYYSEITEQLRSMGIRNPIEFFNDEYMPSAYTDTFNSWTREVR